MNNKTGSKIVLVGGGVGSSTFTAALKNGAYQLSTIVSAFDDGGSTGAIRRDYGGIALGDFRQCLFASLEMHEQFVQALNYRFGKGNLFGVNVGNLLLRAFMEQFKNERLAVRELHRIFGIKNQVMPISYTFAKLQAELDNKQVLKDQADIASYLSWDRAAIKNLFLNKPAKMNPDAVKAIAAADVLAFVPGHFFTSVLPHLQVDGFAPAWKKSKAHKVWFVNLLAHRGQDSFYTLKDYLRWFQKKLGQKPFDTVVINQAIGKNLLKQVAHRFEPVKILQQDLDALKKSGVRVIFADLVSPAVRKQNPNDTVPRAPLRHDQAKIKKFFEKF